jgi:DNA-binding transcriptional MerR regulator
MAVKERHEAKNGTARPRTIGKLAKEAKVNVETIRFYERRGLLRRPKSPVSGWRVYDDSAVWMIHYIKLARQLGFTLTEVKRVMGSLGGGKSFCASVQRAYEDKIGLVGEKIHQLQATRRELRKALAACLKRSATGDCPIAQRCSPQLTVPIEEVRMRR